MRSPLDRVRARLDAFRRAEAADALEALRRDAAPADSPPRPPLEDRARRALGTGENRADLEEALALGLLDPAAHGLVLAHLAEAVTREVEARRQAAGAPTLARLAAHTPVALDSDHVAAAVAAAELATHPDVRARGVRLAALERALDAGRDARLELCAEREARAAVVRARGPASADAAEGSLRADLEAFLRATDDAAQELAARARHAASLRGRGGLGACLEALRAHRLDSLARPDGRAERVGALAARLGLRDTLSRRVRVSFEPALGLRARVIATAPPRAFVVAAPALELGLTSERALVAGAGEALALALAADDAAIEARWPLHERSLARALGALFADLLADSRALARLRGLDAGERRAVLPVASAHVVLGARLAAAQSLSCGTHAHDDEARALAARALGLDDDAVPRELARPTRLAPEAVAADARARLAALALVPALREHFNEDWFENPRAAHALRAACLHGPRLSAEAWSRELGASPVHAAQRAVELASGG